MLSLHLPYLRLVRPGAILLGATFVILTRVAGLAAAGTGALTQLPDPNGCVSDDGSGGACDVGKVLDGPRSVAVSKDGKHIYVASSQSEAGALRNLSLIQSTPGLT